MHALFRRRGSRLLAPRQAVAGLQDLGKRANNTSGPARSVRKITREIRKWPCSFIVGMVPCTAGAARRECNSDVAEAISSDQDWTQP